jgi:SAM-dependent methyltransferase
MHPEARHFLDFVKSAFPTFFDGVRCLDAGAADINGNNRHYFSNSEYIGNDVFPAPNVTILSKTSDLRFADGHFDTIVSSECFEHDLFYSDSLKNIVHMLKPGGLFAFTCASTGRGEHGTLRTTQGCSLTTQLGDMEWANYYKNLTEDDVKEAVPIDDIFEHYQFFYNPASYDLYFWGVKKGGRNDIKAPTYEIHA